MRFRLFFGLLAGWALYSFCGICMENKDQPETGLSLQSRLNLSVCKNIRNETNSDCQQYEEDMKDKYTKLQLKEPKASFKQFLYSYASELYGKKEYQLYGNRNKIMRNKIMSACFYDKAIREEPTGHEYALIMLTDLASVPDNLREAQAYLGFLYLDGIIGGEKNEKEADKWFDKAAAQVGDTI